MKKTAVVLFNLGGPDKPEAVEPFLFNLFYDPAIISLPNPFRFLLAKFISKRRTPIAKEIYNHIGGSSPIVPLTNDQANALENKLKLENNSGDFKVFTVMRYWHPRACDVVHKVADYAPDTVILLPLYPHFSTTTSGSSLNEWKKEFKKINAVSEVKTIGCYPVEPYFIEALVDMITPIYEEAKVLGKPRILFSAHGLPKKIIEKGDPYQWQIEQSAEAVIQAFVDKNIDYTVCYQSKVGRLEWLKPSTEEEIQRAGEDQVPIVIVPIAFVSEHSETLVELDIEYKKLADEQNVPGYFRVPALGDNDKFIAALEKMCINTLSLKKKTTSCTGKRLCPDQFLNCICN